MINSQGMIADDIPAAKALVILGPTATGKTRLAVELARQVAGEVISVDSRQVYVGLDIGSGKDLEEYGEVACHLIDVVGLDREFGLFDFLSLVEKTLADPHSRNIFPIFAGGTGLYLDALLKGYRLVNAPVAPELRNKLVQYSDQQLVDYLLSIKEVHNSTDTQDRERTLRAIEIAIAERDRQADIVQVRLDALVLGFRCDAQALRERIKKRLKTRLNLGLIEEVESLVQQGIHWERLDALGLEYRFVGRYLQGRLNRNDMEQKLAAAIYQFARQQNKWFRRMERQGIGIHWLEAGKPIPEPLHKKVMNLVTSG